MATFDADAPNAVTTVLTSLTITLVPISIGVAILRYRLYEIDRVVSRTVSYATLLGVLGMLYAAAVALWTTMLGGGDPPSWLVAAITLAAAGLFSPLRRRVQRVVDRRFNRTRYDAERVVEGFEWVVRDATDVDAITHEWTAAVRRILHPESVGLWMTNRGMPERPRDLMS